MSRLISTLTIAAILIGMIPAVPSAAGGIRAGLARHSTAADFSQGSHEGTAISMAEDGELELASGRNSGTFTSHVVMTEFEYNAVGINWTEAQPSDTHLEIEIRTSPDGKAWKDWHTIGDGDIPSKSDQHASDLFFTMGRYVQYRANLTANQQGQTPILKDITIKYIDSASGPGLAAARAASAGPNGVVPSGQPFIISRAAWGSPEPYSSVSWPPQYAETRTSVVHHTDTPMYTDPVVAMRAIWYDHAVLRGWGDIGYNYIVDIYGNIFEGRFGGDNVVAAHAGNPYNYGSLGVALIGNYISTPPTAQSMTSLADLLAWKFNSHGIDPAGSGMFYDRYVSNVMGHLDVGATECPGGELYARLMGIRNLVRYRETWWSHNTPQKMTPGQTMWVSLELQNKGTQTWSAGGSTSFDLGYHWYFPSGTQYVQPIQDDHRTSVPWSVSYDQKVTINALLTAPTLPGTYRLEWDMLQENVAWFSSFGNMPLVTTVVVEASGPTATATRTATPSPTATPVPPTLRIDRPSVDFLTVPGSAPRPLRLQVQNSGFGSFSWQATASSESGWLRVEPTSGGQPGEIVVSVDQARLNPSALLPAVLEGSISIQTSPSNVIGNPQSVPVRLVVADRIYPSFLPMAAKAYSGGW